MTTKNSPLEGYKRNIARANHIILKQVLRNLNTNNNERQ